MRERIRTPAELDAFAPRLRQVMADSGALLVLDNLDTLLTPGGAWRDPRWGTLVAALSGHDGESRLILTSRIPPADIDPRVLTLSVHALSLDEAVTLARELPNLRRLLHPDTEQAADRDRNRLRRVLRVAQGHPKLLELADAAAADPEQLDGQLAAAEQAAAGLGLAAFFLDGVSALNPGDFMAALSGWTTNALTVLPAPARLLAQFLACIQEDDRISAIVETTWPEVWRQLGFPGDPPGPRPLLDTLTAAALIQPDVMAVGNVEDAVGGSLAQAVYQMHPGVAAAVAASAEPRVQDAATLILASFWYNAVLEAQANEDGEDSSLIAHAGLAAMPYLLTRGDWADAGYLLEQAMWRDESPGTFQAALPALQRIAAATGAPGHRRLLARALAKGDPALSEQMVRDALDEAAAGGAWRTAIAAAADLGSLLRRAGRLDEALHVADQESDYADRAGLGPWSHLLCRGRRLQVLALMGEHAQVLAETAELRTRMRQLPTRPGPSETAYPWDVREFILNAGLRSAIELGRWELALELNAEIVASVRQRAAGDHYLALAYSNRAGPLIALGRLDEAGKILEVCQQVFEAHQDLDALASVFTTRATLERTRGDSDAAVDLERAAIRLRYTRPDLGRNPGDVAISHTNLAACLRVADGDQAARRAHLLAATLIYSLTGMSDGFGRALTVLADDMSNDNGNAATFPATMAEVIQATSQTDGVRLDKLIAVLASDADAEDALAWIVAAAGCLQLWEPVIAAIAEPDRSDQDTAALRTYLDDQGKDEGWAALTGVFRRILNGERGEDLLNGLEFVESAIVSRTLGRLPDNKQS